MQVRFEQTIEHLVDFSRYHWRHSATAQRSYRLGFLGCPATFLFILYLLRDRGFGVGALAGLAGAGLFCGLYVWSVTRHFGRTVRRFAAEGHGKGILGWHEVEIGVEGVSARTELGESRMSWPSIERVVDDDRYVFIYTQPLAAHIVPKAAFASSVEARAFIDEARRLQESTRR